MVKHQKLPNHSYQTNTQQSAQGSKTVSPQLVPEPSNHMVFIPSNIRGENTANHTSVQLLALQSLEHFLETHPAPPQTLPPNIGSIPSEEPTCAATSPMLSSQHPPCASQDMQPNNAKVDGMVKMESSFRNMALPYVQSPGYVLLPYQSGGYPPHYPLVPLTPDSFLGYGYAGPIPGYASSSYVGHGPAPNPNPNVYYPPCSLYPHGPAWQGFHHWNQHVAEGNNHLGFPGGAVSFSREDAGPIRNAGVLPPLHHFGEELSQSHAGSHVPHTTKY
ncbi:hypothetical protein BDQ17DRAFT_1431824 [Cyathus striatus]|nr:hypothetical protein BDQ17DRAFT_1431824 [Cyathus striatus]